MPPDPLEITPALPCEIFVACWIGGSAALELSVYLNPHLVGSLRRSGVGSRCLKTSTLGKHAPRHLGCDEVGDSGEKVRYSRSWWLEPPVNQEARKTLVKALHCVITLT